MGIYPRNIQDIQEPRIDYPELSYSKDRLSLQDISLVNRMPVLKYGHYVEPGTSLRSIATRT